MTRIEACRGRRAMLALAAASTAAPSALAWGAPATPLCGDSPQPPYPAPDQPPLLQTWLVDGHQDGPAPACGGLRSREFELLVRLTASYLRAGELADQLARFGAVSALTGMSYWSFTDRRWQLLIRDAHAVSTPDTLRPRADFGLAELRRAEELTFVETDNRSSGEVAYALRLLRETPEDFQLRFENVGEIGFMGFTLVARRELQWVVSIERLGASRWGYRSLLGLQQLRLGSDEQHRLSNLSRAAAMFDRFAGRRTEVEAYR